MSRILAKTDECVEMHHAMSPGHACALNGIRPDL